MSAAISPGVRAPTTAAVTAWWRTVKRSEAAASGTPYRGQTSPSRRASRAGDAGA